MIINRNDIANNTPNDPEFDSLRYALGEIISSEKVFSEDAEKATLIIGCILENNDKCKLDDVDINFLKAAKSEFENLASNYDIWNKVGGELKTEKRPGVGLFVNESIEKISTFFGTISNHLPPNSEDSPFTKRVRNCMYLANIFEKLNEITKKEEVKELINSLSAFEKINKNTIGALFITPVQRIPRWELLMRDFEKNLISAFEKYNNNKKTLFDEGKQKNFLEIVTKIKCSFQDYTTKINECKKKVDQLQSAEDQTNHIQNKDGKKRLVVTASIIGKVTSGYTTRPPSSPVLPRSGPNIIKDCLPNVIDLISHYKPVSPKLFGTADWQYQAEFYKSILKDSPFTDDQKELALYSLLADNANTPLQFAVVKKLNQTFNANFSKKEIIAILKDIITSKKSSDEIATLDKVIKNLVKSSHSNSAPDINIIKQIFGLMSSNAQNVQIGSNKDVDIASNKVFKNK